jgi:hypothetical protein
MRNQEAAGTTIVGGEIFELPTSMCTAGSKTIFFSNPPFSATWLLTAEAHMVGFIYVAGATITITMPYPPPSVKTAHGFVAKP